MTEEDSGLKIVCLGGGTGLSSLLSGLKAYVGKESTSVNERRLGWIEGLTAIVTVTDDGGSSGRLREEFQILPPGDIRNCMAALAEDEHLLTRLFQYRFESDGNLSGHSFGNLFLAAMTGVTGDFLDAIRLSSEVLAIKGRIFPSTMEDVALVAELDDGTIVEGESRIGEARARIRNLKLSRGHCRPLPEALDAIKQADLITIGPGSLYTSIIPNLLVDDIVDAMRDSEALKVYICNIMTQPGETAGFSVEEHLRVLFEYSPALELDYIVVNSGRINRALQEKYFADGAIQVEFESMLERSPSSGLDGLVDMGSGAGRQFSIVCDDLINQNDVVRHDPHKLAYLLLNTCLRQRRVALSVVER